MSSTLVVWVPGQLHSRLETVNLQTTEVVIHNNGHIHPPYSGIALYPDGGQSEDSRNLDIYDLLTWLHSYIVFEATELISYNNINITPSYRLI